MMNVIYEGIFSLAFICILMSFINSLAKLLQTHKIYKHKRGGTVSLGYFTVSLVTSFVFFIYGISIDDVVVMLGSVLGILTTSSVVMTYSYFEG